MINSINLFRFNTLLGLHQKATVFGPYKWWSERRFAGQIHLLVLVFYVLGVISGLSIMLPEDSKAAYSVPQEAIYTNTSTNIYGYDLGTHTESAVATAVGAQSSTAIYGDKIVWTDSRNSATTGYDIYMYDLTTHTESAVTIVTGDQLSPAIYGDKIVWEDYRNGNADIYMYNLTTHTESAITTAAGDQYSPAIYDDKIVWEDSRNLAITGYDIYMYDLTTQTESAITTAASDQQNPAIYGDKIVWTDYRNYAITGYDIYMYNLTTHTESAVTTAVGDQNSSAIYGDKIVWGDARNGNADIYMYNLTTSTETQITADVSSQGLPAIYGDKIVWADNRNSAITSYDIYMYDLTTQTESAVTTAAGDQYNPAIYGGRIVWQDDRDNVDASTPRVSNEWTVFYNGSSGSGIYVINNVTKQKRLITATGSNPDIYGDKIVWEDARNGNADIYMYNLTTSTETQITADVSSQGLPAIYGDKIVWADNRNYAITGYDIYMYNLTTQTESAVTTAAGDQYNPAIYGDKIVWDDTRNWAITGYDIYMYDLVTHIESAVATAAGDQQNPTIYGDKIVWADGRIDWDIYMYDVTTHVESAVTTAADEQSFPVIYGDKIIWKDNRNYATTGSDIYMYDLTTQTESAVATAAGDQQNPAIYGDKIVWEDYRNGYSQIYMATLDTALPVFENLPNTYQKINIIDNQIIRITSLNVQTKPADTGSGIEKVEYYLDATLMATSTVPDVNGVFAVNLDMNTAPNKAGGVTLKARAYDNAGNTADYTLNIIPDPWFFPYDGINRIDIFGPEQLTLDANPTTTGDISALTVSAWDNDAPTQVEVSIAGGAFANLPRTNLANETIGATGTFNASFALPNKLSVTYMIRAYDATGNVGTKSGVLAITDNDKPTVTDITPLVGTTGETVNLIIGSTDNIGVLKLQISVNGSAYVDSTNTYALIIPLNSVAPIKIKAKAFDAAGNFVESAEYLVVITDNDAPIITNLTTPVEITNVLNVISVSATDNIAVTRATISFDGVVWVEMTGNTSPFTYTVPTGDLKEDKTLEYFVRVYDATGNFVSTDKNDIKYVAPVENNKKPKDFQSFIRNLKDYFVTFFTNPKEIGSKVLGAFTSVVDIAVQVIKMTPPIVANIFPYILFVLLGVMAIVFFSQAKFEASQSKKLIDILTVERAIYEDKENFLTLSAHYLRTPATIITSGIDLLTGKNQTVKGKLTPIAKSLSQEIQAILKSIENNSYLSRIKKPEIAKEKRFLFLSPFLFVPIMLVAITAIIANMLFIRVAEINISTVNLIAEVLIFAIVVQILITIARYRYTEARNRKEFEQTLSYERQMDKARNKFVDEVGTKIAPYISEIDKHIPRTANKAANSIREGKHRLSDILYKFSLLSESTKGGFRFIHPATVSLKTQARVALSINEGDIKAKQIMIKEDLGDIELRTDPRKIEFIMSSLISNAIKFTKPKTSVGITATKRGKNISIVISDEGPGITEEGKLHLFKPFTRTTSALHFDYEGFGLSLYLSKILISSLGGDIYLDSKVGKGTTVRVEL